MALFDLGSRRRISENFYFDTNSEQMRQLLHAQHRIDPSTLCRRACFTLTQPTQDVVMLIRIDKVLQPAEVADVFDVYAKEERVSAAICISVRISACTSLVRAQNVDRLFALSVDYCERLGAYRMPLCWAFVDVYRSVVQSSAACPSSGSFNSGIPLH